MNLSNYIFEYLLCLSEIIVFYLFLGYLSSSKPKHLKISTTFSIMVTALIIFILTLFQLPIYMKGFFTFSIYLIFSGIHDLSFSHRFFITLCFNLIVVLVETFFISFIFSVFNIHPWETIHLNGQLRYMVALIAKSVNFLCVYMIAKAMKPNKILLPRRYSLLIWGIFLLSIFTMIFLFQHALNSHWDTEISQILLIVCIAFIIINIAFFYYYFTSNRFYIENQKQEIERLYLKANKKYISESKRQSEYLHKIWHDLNNHVKNLELLISDSNHKDSSKYLKSMKNRIDKIPNHIITGNKLADIILNSKSMDATLNNIKFQVRATIPEVLSIEDADFGSVLFNSIDNAIEASLNIEEKENRLIDIKIDCKSEYLCYEIVNNINTSHLHRSKKYFNKKDYISPGYGLMILQDIADKYEGYLDYGIKDGQFVLKIYLLLDEVDKKQI